MRYRFTKDEIMETSNYDGSFCLSIRLDGQYKDEERIAIINRKGDENKEIENKKKMEEMPKLETAILKVKELMPRISELITVANSCINNGFEFPKQTFKYGYGFEKGDSYHFIADGIYHHVGFMNVEKGWWRKDEPKYRKAEYVGIINGGFCGQWDFYIDGSEFFIQHQETKERKQPCYSQLNDFINEYDRFEQAFYRWLDDYCN